MADEMALRHDVWPASTTGFSMFREALDTAPDAVFWMDSQGAIVYVNERACASLGYTRDELSALHIWDIDPSVDRTRWEECWETVLAGATLETHHRRKDGSVFPVEVSAKDFVRGRVRVRVSFVRDVTARKAVTDALRRTQFAVDRARESIFWIKVDGGVAYVNDMACESLGYTREELLEMSVFDFSPTLSPEQWAQGWPQHRETGAFLHETIHRAKSGRCYPVEILCSYVQFEGQEYSCSYAKDITDRRRAEEERQKLESQLLHAQKLESVGRLAGGVAHDFNNMLSVILGYAELIEESLPPGAPIAGAIDEIKRAASRSRDVTRQLLAFSRRQLIAPKPLDLNRVVSQAKNALLRLVGEDIELSFVPGVSLSKIAFDPSQMDQLLINLVVNARDALPKSGTIRLETTNVRLAEEDCRDHAEANPGPYVVLSVSDDGVGIERDVLPYIFDPFFTTKEVGKGTGLGLATVYGILRQNGGFVDVRSTPGVGTTVKLYIPALPADAIEARPPPKSRPVHGLGTVLVVEDDDMVCNMTKAMLEALDYTVLVASTPGAALAMCERPDLRVDLLISDVIMPEMRGPELRDRLRTMRPDLKVVFMSGYADVMAHDGAGEQRENFIQKPFSMSDLARAARMAIRTTENSQGDGEAVEKDRKSAEKDVYGTENGNGNTD